MKTSYDKLSPPAFVGESQTDRDARAALYAKPAKCSETCTYAIAYEHSADCPRYVKPSDELPF